MINWLVNNIGTIIVLLGLIALVVAIIQNMIKEKKQGKTSCGCNCSHCAMATACHKIKNRQ